MEITLLVVAAALALALVAVVAVTVRPWNRALKQRVIVVLLDDTTIDAVLLARRGPLLELGDARVMHNGQPVPVDGVMLVERDRVRWVQVAT